ncbi:uncharacterized protein BDZ99DRAFT_349441, partial [Mytilinidion resinicola]
CDHSPTYSTQLLSFDPLVLYIDNFLDASEITYLLSLGQPLFTRSMITDRKISSGRTSDSCFLPGNNSMVARIKQRAAHFMGGLSFDGLEAVQLVRYTTGQKVNLHFDWHQTRPLDRQGRSCNRLASFFIYLSADCVSGETWFPNVTVSRDLFDRDGWAEERIRVLEEGKGIAFLPRAGSGVFWMNLRSDGTGDQRSLHAGLPVVEGTKVGMNIWVKK